MGSKCQLLHAHDRYGLQDKYDICDSMKCIAKLGVFSLDKEKKKQNRTKQANKQKNTLKCYQSS